jgi:glycosyltransferase involved in cell wall biosynthesis
VDVKVLAPHASGSETRELLHGIEVKRFVYFLPKRLQRVAYGSGIPANLKRSVFLWLELPFFFSAFLLNAIRLVKQSDIIHCQWTFSGFLGVVLKWVFRKPLIITVHGSDINLVLNRGFLKRLTSLVLQQADRVIAVSEDLRKKALTLGAAPDKVRVIYHGVDPERFFPQKSGTTRKLNLLWIGRLSPEKGLFYLVKAMKRVLEEFPGGSLTLVSAGDENAMRELTDLIDREGVRESIRIEGNKKSDELPSLMKQADLFVLPSLSEGTPVVVIEAMASGLPVVASRIGGVPEVVEEGITGILVPPADSAALSEALLRLLKDPDKREEMGRKGRERVIKLFSWDKTIEATLNVYQDVLR